MTCFYIKCNSGLKWGNLFVPVIHKVFQYGENIGANSIRAFLQYFEFFVLKKRPDFFLVTKSELTFFLYIEIEDERLNLLHVIPDSLWNLHCTRVKLSIKAFFSECY